MLFSKSAYKVSWLLKKLQNRANVICERSLRIKDAYFRTDQEKQIFIDHYFLKGLWFKAYDYEVEIGKMAHWDRSSKDARLAFYQTADVKNLKYDDLAPEIVSEVDPECLEALIKLLIAMLEVRFLKLE